MTPTTEELIKKYRRGDDAVLSIHVQELMKNFAKLHVEAALKSAVEKAETEYEPHWSGEQEGSTYINRDSILNSYDLNQIQ